MYGIIPSANIAILVTAPPENILNIPSKPFWLEAITSFKTEGSREERMFLICKLLKLKFVKKSYF